MSSTSKRSDASSSGQKTDFLQRTVKIFTGKKSQPPPAPSLPVVIVPTRPRRTEPPQQQNQGRPKPSVWPHVLTLRWHLWIKDDSIARHNLNYIYYIHVNRDCINERTFSNWKISSKWLQTLLCGTRYVNYNIKNEIYISCTPKCERQVWIWLCTVYIFYSTHSDIITIIITITTVANQINDECFRCLSWRFGPTRHLKTNKKRNKRP